MDVLLELVAGRRIVVLTGGDGALWPGLLDQLARHVGASGCLVLTASARPGSTLSDLLAEALDTCPRLLAAEEGDEGTPALLARVQQEVERHSFGVLLVEDAHRLGVEALRDLVGMASDGEPGRMIQLVLAGGAELPSAIERAGLADSVELIGRVLELPAFPAAADDDAWRARWIGKRLLGRLADVPRPGWGAAVLAAAYVAGYVAVTALHPAPPPASTPRVASAPVVTIREADLPRLSGTLPASFMPAEEPVAAIAPPLPPDPPQKAEKPQAEQARAKPRARRQTRPAAAAPCDDSYRRNAQVQTLGDFGKAFATDLKSVGRCLGSLLAG